MTRKELVKEINNCISDLQNGATNCKIELGDPDLAIFIGWESGFGKEKRDDVLQSKDDPDYAIVAAIKIKNEADWANFESLNMPIYTDESGEVYDSTTSFDPRDYLNDFEMVADILLNEYKKIKKLLAKKKLTIDF